MVYRAIGRVCPGCSTELQRQQVEVGNAARRGSFDLEQCGKCEGQLVDDETFRAMVDSIKPGTGVPQMLEHEDGTPRRRCPTCGEPMPHVWLDFLSLERCPDHGYWFDRGELRLALRSVITPPFGEELAALAPKKPGRWGG